MAVVNISEAANTGRGDYLRDAFGNINEAFEQIGANVKDPEFGATGDGTTDDTAAFVLARDAILASTAGSGTIFIPNGIYKVSGLVFDQRVSLLGESRRGVVFKPTTTGVTVLTLKGFSAYGYSEQATYEKFTINCLSGSTPISGTVGLVVGGLSPYDFGRNRLSDIYINGAGSYGFVLASATGNLFQNIYVENCGGYGCFTDNESSVQFNTFILCVFRQNSVGYYAGSGNNMAFIVCDFESNKNQGTYFSRRVSNGFAHNTFNACWWENNNHTPTVDATERGEIYFDGISTFDGSTDQTTLPMNNVFTCCNISSATGNYDIVADRGQNNTFDRCKFSRGTGAFTSSKFRFNSGNLAVQIFLKQCGTLLNVPTPTMYASFPAPSTNGDERYGFFYEFVWKGQKYTNWFPDSGSYTPTHTIGSNLSATTVYTLYYAKVGNIVNVWGRVGADAVSATTTVLFLSLPTASNLAGDGDLAGSANSWLSGGNETAVILADGSGDRAKMLWTAASVADRDWFVNFSYRII